MAGVKGHVSSPSVSTNPFLKAAAQLPSGGSQVSKTVAPQEQAQPASGFPGPSSSKSNNPFFAAMSAQAGAPPPAAHVPPPPPPSYAAAVMGRPKLADPRIPASVPPKLADPRLPTSGPPKTADPRTTAPGPPVLTASQLPPPPPPNPTAQLAAASFNPFLASQTASQKTTAAPLSQVPVSQVPQKSPTASATSTTLHLKGVPAEMNSDVLLREHFGRFGRVVTVKCNPAKMCASISFQTHVSESGSESILQQALLLIFCD